MKKKQIILSALSVLCIGTANAQTDVIKASVVQNGTTLETAQFDVSSAPSFTFDGDNLVMTLGDGTAHIAEIPVKNNGTMSVEFSASDDSNNKKSVTVTSASYATFASAFQTVVPSGVNVYAATYADSKLKLNSATQLATGTVLPAGTGVILKGSAADYDFVYSSEAASTDAKLTANSLVGSVIAVPVTELTSGTGIICSLAQEDGKVGFYRYTPEYTQANKAFLVLPSASAKIVGFDFDDEPTGIESAGQIVRSEELGVGSEIYNLNGARVNQYYKGIVIKNGKKFINK